MHFQVKALCAEADRLQQSHPLSAAQIQVKREELIANWEQIRTLAAERHARLNDSYRWGIISWSSATGGVAPLLEKREGGPRGHFYILRALLYTCQVPVLRKKMQVTFSTDVIFVWRLVSLCVCVCVCT